MASFVGESQVSMGPITRNFSSSSSGVRNSEFRIIVFAKALEKMSWPQVPALFP